MGDALVPGEGRGLMQAGVQETQHLSWRRGSCCIGPPDSPFPSHFIGVYEGPLVGVYEDL